jgi:translation initiation factor IF-1
MVKNTKGGNKSKAIARKHAVSNDHSSLRTPVSVFETFAVVTKILGNGMFYASILDGISLLGHIRKKFKGRFKRDNSISLGSIVLVGLRDWEQPNFKECDLLEVFDPNEVRELMKNPIYDLSSLFKHIDYNNNHYNTTNDIVFSDEHEHNHLLTIDTHTHTDTHKQYHTNTNTETETEEEDFDMI